MKRENKHEESKLELWKLKTAKGTKHVEAEPGEQKTQVLPDRCTQTDILFCASQALTREVEPATYFACLLSNAP